MLFKLATSRKVSLSTAGSSSQINLSWNDNSNNETGFKIERKEGAGGLYGQVAMVGAGAEAYSDSGLNPSTTYYYRARAYGTAGDSGYSNEDSATTPAFTSISVTSPNGGESWAAGDVRTITWSYAGNPGSYVKIELYKGGALNSTITSYTSVGSAGSGSYSWTISSSQASGTDYQIKVTSTTNGSYTDMSNSNFTINPPSIAVISPNGGESWAAGDVRTISWSYTGNPGTYVKIELYKGGALNSTLSYSTSKGSGGSGSYNWTISSGQTPGTDYQIKVTSTTNSSYTDTSDNSFTIAGPPPPSITVTMPNGGESWSAGAVKTISWTYTDNPGTYVKIELVQGGSIE